MRSLFFFLLIILLVCLILTTFAPAKEFYWLGQVENIINIKSAW